MAPRVICRLCRSPIRSWEDTVESGVCKPCDLAIFQLEDALEQYTSGVAPDWLRKAMPHFSWLFDSYPLAAAYLNLSMEILYEFVVEEVTTLQEDTLQEVRFMRISPATVKAVLERAHLIEQHEDAIRMGAITKELSKTRLAAYHLGSEEFIQKVNEIRGIVCFALTISLVRDSRFVPQRPLSPLRALGMHILDSGLENESAIPRVLQGSVFDQACRMMSDRQFKKMKWYMAGFATGRPYVIDDIEFVGDDEQLVLHEDILAYLERIRTRYRERLRERERDRS